MFNHAMILYNTTAGPVVQHNGAHYALPGLTWEQLVNADELAADLASRLREGKGQPIAAPAEAALLPPIGDRQELWAAGVTYFRSRTARMEEADTSGGGGASFYDKVYLAERPELFMKATPHRVVGTGQAMHLRRDSKWMVPEPELTLVVTRTGKIIGYTIGNDLSCRDIEGENPLYLPQAKTFDRCAALGPGILVSDQPLPVTTAIKVEIHRGGQQMFAGATDLSQLKKSPQQLVSYLFRDNTFPHGVLLLTGTGVVPPNDFTLRADDVVRIEIDGIGTLVNAMG